MKKIANRTKAQDVIAELFVNHMSEAARERVQKEARFSKQSQEEVVRRFVGNLLTSYSMYR